MKRRNFIAAAAALGAGTVSGCSRAVKVKQELSPHAFDTKVAKPVGAMQYKELGTTGIKVSKFGFGSHMRQDIVPFQKEREFMIREAHDLGVTLFDVYDKEQECHQYEPMGRYLKPVINDVVISISILPWDGRTLEQELERDLRAFGRDHLDMVRIHSYTSDSDNWVQWDSLFKWKEQ
jgi:predicted aldo/keto reductase-like oxidoreductase